MVKRLECNKCKWVWNYKGIKEYYTICPNCRGNVNLKKCLVKDGTEAKKE